MQKSKSQLKIKKYFIAIFFFFSAISSVSAAELKLISPVTELVVDQEFQADFILNSENQSINAIEGKIVFPENLLELKETRDGNSIINFWINKPEIKNGELIFSGITPGGYNEERGFIFSLIFKSKKAGQGIVEAKEVRALLNDGQGTPVKVKIKNLEFKIQEFKEKSNNAYFNLSGKYVEDKDPPESFVPIISKDEGVFGGKYFLVFATQDKGSGIDYFKVKETKYKNSFFGFWRKAESPYLLKDQNLQSYVFVKAVDKNGNKRIEMLFPQKQIFWYENYNNWIILIIVLIIGVFLLKMLRNKQYEIFDSK